MKVIGEINIGVPIIQVDNLEIDFAMKAPKGSYVYDNPMNVFEKTGKNDEAWTRSTFRVMMMNILTWAVTMIDNDENQRKEAVNSVMNSILTFKEGEKSKEGTEAVSFLKNECKIVGFVPSVTYIMPKERGEGSLDCFWEHPFSMPTLLLKHKTLPFLIISNGILDFDDSRLVKMSKMKELKINEEQPLGYDIELEKDKLQGITG